MVVIDKKFLHGGSGLTPEGSAGHPSVTEALREVADDLGAIRDALIAVLAKLDGDLGVADSNYATLHTPSTNKTQRG